MLALSGSTLATGLAGCGRSVGTAETVQRVISTSGIASVPDEANVGLGVEQLASEVTPEQSAQFRVTTTNLGKKRRISVAPGQQCCLFNRDKGASTPRGLWLIHKAEPIPEPDGDHWTTDRPKGGDYGCSSPLYTQGEAVTNDYRLWDDSTQDGYLLLGRIASRKNCESKTWMDRHC
jgi:hypothetical protein